MKKQNKLLIFSTILIILTVIFTGCDNASTSTPAQNGSESYTITKTEGILNGTLETNKITATAGEIIRITATPSIGYMVQTITVIGADNTHVTVNGTGNDRTFTMPAQNVTVYASFTETTFSITVAECSNGSFSIDKTEAATNQMVCVTVNPNLYYELDTITITDANGNMIPLNSSNMFTMPACSVTISGTFKIVLPLKSPSAINYILLCLGADSTATKFIHSEVAPSDEVETYLLSKDDSVFDVYAWRDGTTIYFYAHNFTDCNRKIPLNTDSSEIFNHCTKLQEIELSYFDTSNVTDTSYMFNYCSALTSLDLSDFDTSNVTDMQDMFDRCSKLTSLNLSDFDTSNVTNMSFMFFGCSALETIYASSSFDVTSVTDSVNMFYNCSSLIGGAGTTFNQLHTNKEYARIDNSPDAPGYFTSEQ